MSGWGDFFGKIADQFQGRVERLKNEKASLVNERQDILSKKFTAADSVRIVAIDTRLQQINEALGNKATD